MRILLYLGLLTLCGAASTTLLDLPTLLAKSMINANYTVDPQVCYNQIVILVCSHPAGGHFPRFPEHDWRGAHLHR